MIGFHRIALETFESLDTDDKELLQSYSNGVNDFLSNVKLFSEGASAHLLPPEFYAVGLKEVEPWTPVNSLEIAKLLNFHLSWNWQQDLTRDWISGFHKDLEEIIGEIVPHTAEFSHDLVTILDDDDIKQQGQWSEQTLTERAKKNAPPKNNK